MSIRPSNNTVDAAWAHFTRNQARESAPSTGKALTKLKAIFSDLGVEIHNPKDPSVAESAHSALLPATAAAQGPSEQLARALKMLGTVGITEADPGSEDFAFFDLARRVGFAVLRDLSPNPLKSSIETARSHIDNILVHKGTLDKKTIEIVQACDAQLRQQQDAAPSSVRVSWILGTLQQLLRNSAALENIQTDLASLRQSLAGVLSKDEFLYEATTEQEAISKEMTALKGPKAAATLFLLKKCLEVAKQAPHLLGIN